MFTVIYHPKVRSDFRKIDPALIPVIREAIQEKIAQDPELYGKPLRYTLKHLRSLRIGEYRIVYAVKKKQILVLVLIIGKRDTVYSDVLKRMA